MAAILAILPQILTYLPTAVTAGRAFVDWIIGLRATAQQTAQWTPEMETAFINWLISLATQSQWLPTPVAAPEPITTTVVTTTTPAASAAPVVTTSTNPKP